MSHRNQTQDYFDKQFQAMNGDEKQALDHSFYRYLLPYAKSRVDIAIELLGNQHFENVADLACGNCQLVARKIDSFEHYTGFDISNYQVSQGATALRAHPKISLQQHDLNQTLPCAGESFDLVISLSVIEYLFDPYTFIREIYRVLKPQGRLVIQVENVAFLLRRLQLFLGILPTYNKASGWQGGYLHHFTYPEMRKLLRDEGFNVLAERCSGIVPKLRMWWPNLLAADMVLLCQKKS